MLSTIALISSTQASTIQVPADAATIQAGIDAASPGDTVLVAPGVYTGPANRNLDFNGKDLIVRSSGGRDVTTIDCELLGRGFHLNSGETSASAIEGFTIRRGNALDDPYEPYTGGGIYCDGAAPTIADCRVVECTAFHGGGLWLNLPTRIERTIIADNRADRTGGGMTCERATLVQCTIEGNLAGFSDAGFGGGIYCYRSLVMTDCHIAGNTSQSYGDDSSSWADGGGVYVATIGNEARLTRCTFMGNSALGINDDSFNQVQGGGAALLAASVVVIDCLFQENLVRCESLNNIPIGNLASGGGLACGDGAIILGCVFDRNSVSAIGGPNVNLAQGGGLYCGAATVVDCRFSRSQAASLGTAEAFGLGGGVSAAAGAQFTGCTFAFNSSTTAGSAVHVRTPGTVQIDNTIIAFSEAAQAVSCTAGGSLVITCSDLFGNPGGDWTGCAAGQENGYGNFSADPLFCNAAIGNYHLNGDSPCALGNSPGNCDLIGAHGVGCGVVSVPAADSPPVETMLAVAPNPLAGAGWVELRSTRPGPGMLKLYDSAGRLVVGRDLGHLGPGTHRFAWEEVAGRRLPAGIYYLRMESWLAGKKALPVVVLR